MSCRGQIVKHISNIDSGVQSPRRMISNSKHGDRHEPDLYCSVFDESGVVGKLSLSASQPYHSLQKRSNINPVHGHDLNCKSFVRVNGRLIDPLFHWKLQNCCTKKQKNGNSSYRDSKTRRGKVRFVSFSVFLWSFLIFLIPNYLQKKRAYIDIYKKNS